MSNLTRDSRFDSKLTVIRDPVFDYFWDGSVKTLVYDTTLMQWVAQTTTGGSGSVSTLTADTSSIETRSKAMKTAVDEASATVTYVGESTTGSATSASLWRIKRLTQAGTVLLTEWAGGTGSFNNVWDNRASLTYT